MEADQRKLATLQKELEIIEKDRAKKSVVDVQFDDKPLGRLVLQHGNIYDFKVKSQKEDCNELAGELVADIKIDGKDGPIPKIIKKRDTRTNVFVDDGNKITKHTASREEAKSLAGLKMSDGTTLA